MPSRANTSPLYAFSYFFDRFVEEAGIAPNQPIKISSLTAKAIEACTTTPSALKKKYSGEESDYTKQCSDLMYLTSLLTAGYQFSEAEDSVVFAKKINEVETAWTLGAVLDISN